MHVKVSDKLYGFIHYNVEYVMLIVMYYIKITIWH
jgi:hypothetical protein